MLNSFGIGSAGRFVNWIDPAGSLENATHRETFQASRNAGGCARRDGARPAVHAGEVTGLVRRLRLAKAESQLHSHEGKEYLMCVDSRFLSSPPTSCH